MRIELDGSGRRAGECFEELPFEPRGVARDRNPNWSAIGVLRNPARVSARSLDCDGLVRDRRQALDREVQQ